MDDFFREAEEKLSKNAFKEHLEEFLASQRLLARWTLKQREF